MNLPYRIDQSCMRASRVVFLIFALCVASPGCDRQVVVPSGSSKTPDPAGETQLSHRNFQGAAMGTTWRLTITQAKISEDRADQVEKKIKDVIQEVEGAMSTFIPDSELSIFNKTGANIPVKVSPGTLNVVYKALQIAELTSGAFDPTVWPLVRLWGFGDSEVGDNAPTNAQIEKAAELVDYRAVIVDNQNETFVKTREGISLDLASIAKGYAVDRVWEALDSWGYTDYMIEIGGEVRTKGKNITGMPWRIGIDKPSFDKGPGEELQTVVHLSGEAVATSGDYRNFRSVSGRRISHTIDPRLKGPIRHNLASATVISPTCLDADALATAANVLGAEEGKKLIESIPDAQAYFITRVDEKHFKVDMTSGFAKYLKQD
jgi:FAD:protein FMN transferase